MVMEVVQEDMSEGSMQCTDHPFKNSTPGGICAFCLQEKLGKLVSSSFPIAVFPSSSSSSSPSFRSDFVAPTNNTTSTLSSATNTQVLGYGDYHSRRAKLPFLLTHRKKKKKDIGMMAAAADSSSIVFTRSKSTFTSTPRHSSHFMEGYDDSEDYSPQKRRFWKFLYLKHSSSAKKSERAAHRSEISDLSSSVSRSIERKREDLVVVDEDDSPDQAAFDRKVSRSRSVGCGSRSFSGDFFERISTGFGDCTLRRVESQREGKPRIHSMHHRNSVVGGGGQDCNIKERVKCGGIFSGFMISSSSSSSSSSLWVSSNEENNSFNGRSLVHSRSKSWGWAFASPMRAFSSSNKPSNSGKRDASNKNATPNLAAIPSLLAARG